MSRHRDGHVRDVMLATRAPAETIATVDSLLGTRLDLPLGSVTVRTRSQFVKLAVSRLLRQLGKPVPFAWIKEEA